MRSIESEVANLLNGDHGHGFDHVARVRAMALKFAEHEKANQEIVELASLLHDVDDYKLFGEESAKHLSNATAILTKYQVSETVQADVLEIIRTMGYNKSLEGIRPTTLEGKIVSDADMCDAIGAEGILRTHAYALSKGNVLFDATLSPELPTTDASRYRASKKSHSVQHFFDKLLIIPTIMMTEAGKIEAQKRSEIMTLFLEELFRESNTPEWREHLSAYQENLSNARS